MKLSVLRDMLADAAGAFVRHHAVTLAAAMAFYTVLALAPLLVILVAVTGWVGYGTQGRLIEHVESQAGLLPAAVVASILHRARDARSLGWVSASVSFAALLFWSTAAFVHLQRAMNTIREVQPGSGRRLWGWLRKRLVSLAMVGLAWLLVIVSLAFSIARSRLAGGDSLFWGGLDQAVSLAVFALLFAMVFRVLPDAKIPWSDAWAGAAVTAVLFVLGKWSTGRYLAYSFIGSIHGVAGSLLVLLVWIYYCSLIVFFGAELTHAYARRRGSGEPAIPPGAGGASS